jgi:hypothetical protein
MSTPLSAIELPELTASDAFQRAVDIAAEYAEDVDRQGRFPSEAVAALQFVPMIHVGIGRHQNYIRSGELYARTPIMSCRTTLKPNLRPVI